MSREPPKPVVATRSTHLRKDSGQAEQVFYAAGERPSNQACGRLISDPPGCAAVGPCWRREASRRRVAPGAWEAGGRRGRRRPDPRKKRLKGPYLTASPE